MIQYKRIHIRIHFPKMLFLSKYVYICTRMRVLSSGSHFVLYEAISKFHSSFWSLASYWPLSTILIRNKMYWHVLWVRFSCSYCFCWCLLFVSILPYEKQHICNVLRLQKMTIFAKVRILILNVVSDEKLKLCCK